MPEFDDSHYEDVKTWHDAISDTRNRLHEEGIQRHDKSALRWADPVWVNTHNDLLYKAPTALNLLRGYSYFVSPVNHPGMIFDADRFPEYARDDVPHPQRD